MRISAMIYVDQVFRCRPTKMWPYSYACHLYADTLDELHDFAAKLGLKNEWFQPHRFLPHYDITRNKRRIAISLGAVAHSFRSTIEWIKSCGEEYEA